MSTPVDRAVDGDTQKLELLEGGFEVRRGNLEGEMGPAQGILENGGRIAGRAGTQMQREIARAAAQENAVGVVGGAHRLEELETENAAIEISGAIEIADIDPKVVELLQMDHRLSLTDV